MKKVLSIAGSDCSGGAGIQADIKTMLANGVYAMSVITALTAQNTLGVRSVFETDVTFLRDQLDAVFEDIYPDAVKIGMVSSSSLVNIISDRLLHYEAKNIVVDPVMIATSGHSLIENDAVSALAKQLLPLATVVTPNIPEAQVLAKTTINCKHDMETSAISIGKKYNCAVLLKGGHRVSDADDVLFVDGEIYWFCGDRVDTSNTHGTGCTLSSAIASNLAKNYSLYDSVKRSKQYISGALAQDLDLGHGSGPLNHAFDITSIYIK